MNSYYNEFDPKAAAWLRELIKARLLPDGHVDERSITDVSPDDLDGFDQCHFFAGIGGWAHAIRLAGIRDDEPLWTGSCPCQPFSNAGNQLADRDERHLWPAWFRLIRERGPATIFGEQVASPLALGWLDGVFDDLEGANYACGSSDLCAASVNAPHPRQRLFWVADANGGKSRNRELQSSREYGFESENDQTLRMGISHCAGSQSRIEAPKTTRYGNPAIPAGDSGYWSGFEIIECTDRKSRRIEPGTFPLAHGVSSRVGLLRGYGNAIVPEVAAQFIQAFYEIA